MRESSIVWMHGADDEQLGREAFQNNESQANIPTGQKSFRNSHSSSDDCSYSMHNNQNNNQKTNNSRGGRMQGVNTDIRQLDTSKFMFYSSRTGVALASSLIEPASGDMGIDDLIDNVLGSDAETEKEGACFWLDIAGASGEEIGDIGDIFELHPLTIEDMIRGSQRDKIDVFGDYVYLANGGMVPPYTKEAPLSGLVDFPPYIVYAILDEITDQLSPEIIAIEQQVDAIDELVLVLSHNEHENMLRRMGEQRRRILTTWQSTQPKIEVVETLAHMLSSRMWAMQSGLAEEVSQYLGDIHGHLAAAIGSCSRAEAVLSRSHSNYLAKISLELSRATFDSNSTTERWTMLGTIVVPINIVTSFLGVNLKVPGQDRDDTLNFFIVMACMVIYASATLAFWRWRQII
ncbi:CorA metal ion transporter [Coemansia sp. RSA 2607]|nr:CorA metal ion transporter [Coemansia sp. RSA 2607]